MIQILTRALVLLALAAPAFGQIGCARVVGPGHTFGPYSGCARAITVDGAYYGFIPAGGTLSIPDDLSLCGQSFNVCFYTVCSGQGPQLELCCRYTINCGM